MTKLSGPTIRKKGASEYKDEEGLSMSSKHTAIEATASEETSRRERCDKEIDEIFKIVNNDQAEYDKQLLTLSSGFLAVSLAFIKDVVPLKDAQDLPVLYLAYILLSTCIVFVLFSYQFSIAGHLKAKAYWEAKSGGADGPFPYGYAEGVKWLNRASGILFFLGVSLVVAFVIVNLHHEANMALTKDGAYIRTPSSGTGEERGSLIKAPAKPPAVSPKPSGTGGSSQPPKQ